jgi:RNA polymerase sigma-B factor
MPLAYSIAARYQRTAEPSDDLRQVAATGLIKAIDRYDPSRPSAFTSFAVPTIDGELKRHFRDHAWAVRPPRRLQELALCIDAVTNELARELGRSPTTAELSTALGVDEELLLEALVANTARAALSLQARVSSDDDATLEDWIGHDDGGIAWAEDHAVLTALLPTLSPRERLVIRLRFDKDMTQAQIAASVGVSQIGVSRIIRRSLHRLRAAAG